MEKLLESLTRAANAVAAYYEDQVRPRPPMTPAEIAAAKVAMQAHVAEHAAMAGKPRTGPTHEEHVAAHIAAAKEPPQEVPVEPVVKRKAGRPKKNPTAAAPAPAEPAMLPIDPEYASLTDAESAKKIFEVGEALIEAFPALGANGPDGEPAPEGFHLVVALLKEKFGQERIAKLNHSQRLQFMTLAKAKLGAAAAAPAGEDPNAGI